MKLSNAEIQQSIAALPDNIKNAVITFDWAKEILDIAHEHNMQIDDADEFRHQTLLVILGKIPAEQYEHNLVSELGFSKQLAASLVDEANSRIFLQLQKRAFSKNNFDNETTTENHDEIISDDPYQEPIEHHELKNILSSEGVHLVDEPEPRIFDNDLHDEVSAILNEVNIKDHETTHTETITDDIPEPNQKPEHTQNPYQEPIDTKDLRGITGHRTNTSIIKTQHHNTPDDIFTDKPRKQFPDLGQGDYEFSTIDKHILENPFSAKTETIEASLSENEQIREEGTFLEHLTKED